MTSSAAASEHRKRPRVFVRHATQDRERVERDILAALRAQGAEPWYAGTDIQTATAWERSIKHALESCDWYLVVLTPPSVDSDWVKTEVHWALERRPDRVVPVMLEDCRPEDLHLKLLRIQYLDFRQDLTTAQARLAALWGTA